MLSEGRNEQIIEDEEKRKIGIYNGNLSGVLGSPSSMESYTFDNLKDIIEKLFKKESEVIFENILDFLKKKRFITLMKDGDKNWEIKKAKQVAFGYFCDILSFYNNFLLEEGLGDDDLLDKDSLCKLEFKKEIFNFFGEGYKKKTDEDIKKFMDKYASAPLKNKNSLYGFLKNNEELGLSLEEISEKIYDYLEAYNENKTGADLLHNPFALGASNKDFEGFIDSYKKMEEGYYD